MNNLLLQATDWGQGLVTEQLLYRYSAIVLAVVALGFLIWTARLSGRHRRYGLLATWVTGVIAVTYFGMSIGLLRFESIDGNAVPLTRFVGYQFSIALIILMTGTVAGLSRRMRVLLLLPFFMITGGTAGGWFLSEPLNTAASLSSLLSLPFAAYLLLGPGKRAAARTTAERKLLFGKLTNVVLLVWLGYLVVGVVSRQNAALLDAFVGVFLGIYLDAMIHVAFGALLLRHTGALEHMIAARGGDDGSTLDDGSADPDGAAAAD